MLNFSAIRWNAIQVQRGEERQECGPLFIDDSTIQEVRKEKSSETNPLRLIARSNSKYFKQIEDKEKSSSIGVDDSRNWEYEHAEKGNRIQVCGPLTHTEKIMKATLMKSCCVRHVFLFQRIYFLILGIKL